MIISTLNYIILNNSLPFWQNGWFYISLVLLLLIIAVFLIMQNLTIKSKGEKDIKISAIEQELNQTKDELLKKESKILELDNELKSGSDTLYKEIEALKANLQTVTKSQIEKEILLSNIRQEFEFYKKHHETNLQEQTERLTKEKEKAEESDKMKTAFISNLSHEIRTPMNGIIGFSQLLASPGISEERKNEYINMIVESGKSLLFMIDDIIDISKIDTEQLVLNKTNIFLNKLLKELLASYQSYLDQKGRTQLTLKLKKGVDDDYFSVNTDITRLRQALSHLLNNAVKYTDNGFIEFGYDLIKQNNTQILRFFVKDSGIGLPKDKQTVIFERFSKLNDDKNKVYRGAGLGLTITKNLIKLLGGEIWVESEVGKGSTFFFTLPIGQVEQNKTDDTKHGQPNIEKPDWHNITILIAEDDFVNYKYLEASLRDTRARLIWAKNGEEAVRLFNEIDNLNIVLMDIQMPVMNGYEATKQIKTIDSKIPIIAQTAFAMDEDRILGTKAGCIDYLKKPIKLKDLIQTLSKYI